MYTGKTSESRNKEELTVDNKGWERYIANVTDKYISEKSKNAVINFKINKLREIGKQTHENTDERLPSRRVSQLLTIFLALKSPNWVNCAKTVPCPLRNTFGSYKPHNLYFPCKLYRMTIKTYAAQ